MARLSISEAARRVGITRQTMHKHATAGRITVLRDGDAPEIDEAELFRVYGDKLTPSPVAPPVASIHEVTTETATRIQALEQELQATRQEAAARESWMRRHCDDLVEQLAAAQRQLEHRPAPTVENDVATPSDKAAGIMAIDPAAMVAPTKRPTLWELLRAPLW